MGEQSKPESNDEPDDPATGEIADLELEELLAPLADAEPLADAPPARTEDSASGS